MRGLIFAALMVARAWGMTGMGFNSLSGWPGDAITHVRIWDSGNAWNQIHLGVDTYNWAGLDQEVAQARQVWGNSVQFTYVVGGCPRWLAKYPDNPNYAPWLGPGSNSMPYDIDEFNKFIWQLTSRYNGVINYFEIWNEPQLADFLYPYNSAELNTLATMTQRAYSTIHSLNPGAMVISSPMLPRASSGGMTKAQQYINAIKAKGWNVDAFATHIYPNNGEGVDVWKSMAEDCQNTLRASGAPNTKLWVTETYYNLLGPIIPEASAKSYVDGTYQACKDIGIAQLYWYGWDQGANLGGLQISASSAAWAAIRVHA